jgi:uncharacterized membrane protein
VPVIATTHRPEIAMPMSPVIMVHVVFAIGALVLGPFALLARKGSRLHRLAGYAWVTLMLLTAASSLFIRDFRLPNIAGYTPIHLVTLLTFAGIAAGVTFIVRRKVAAHRRVMRRLYFGACIGAGLFALLPGRILGQMLWHQALGIV